jgi:hypothetical protein
MADLRIVEAASEQIAEALIRGEEAGPELRALYSKAFDEHLVGLVKRQMPKNVVRLPTRHHRPR